MVAIVEIIPTDNSSVTNRGMPNPVTGADNRVRHQARQVRSLARTVRSGANVVFAPQGR